MSSRKVAQLNRLKAQLRLVVADAIRDAYDDTALRQSALAKLESEWQLNAMRQASGLEDYWKAPAVATLRAVVSDTLQNGFTLKEHFDGLSLTAAKRIQREVNIGVSLGEATSTIVARVRKTYPTTRANAETIVRTSANAISARARELVFIDNDVGVKLVQLVAVLDSRTSIICMNYDGKRFPVNEGPRPPFHPNCRTTVVPVLDSWSSLGLKNPPPGTRASMNGQVADTVTYPEWLKAQPKSVQDDALGKTRAELFRSGKLSVDRFLSDGRVLTLKALGVYE